MRRDYESVGSNQVVWLWFCNDLGPWEQVVNKRCLVQLQVDGQVFRNLGTWRRRLAEEEVCCGMAVQDPREDGAGQEGSNTIPCHCCLHSSGERRHATSALYFLRSSRNPTSPSPPPPCRLTSRRLCKLHVSRFTNGALITSH
jgi:hypothetical protein